MEALSLTKGQQRGILCFFDVGSTQNIKQTVEWPVTFMWRHRNGVNTNSSAIITFKCEFTWIPAGLMNGVALENIICNLHNIRKIRDRLVSNFADIYMQSPRYDNRIYVDIPFHTPDKADTNVDSNRLLVWHDRNDKNILCTLLRTYSLFHKLCALFVFLWLYHQSLVNKCAILQIFRVASLSNEEYCARSRYQGWS